MPIAANGDRLLLLELARCPHAVVGVCVYGGEVSGNEGCKRGLSTRRIRREVSGFCHGTVPDLDQPQQGTAELGEL
jgi:hypothetical protein